MLAFFLTSIHRVPWGGTRLPLWKSLHKDNLNQYGINHLSLTCLNVSVNEFVSVSPVVNGSSLCEVFEHISSSIYSNNQILTSMADCISGEEQATSQTGLLHVICQHDALLLYGEGDDALHGKPHSYLTMIKVHSV